MAWCLSSFWWSRPLIIQPLSFSTHASESGKERNKISHNSHWYTTEEVKYCKKANKVRQSGLKIIRHIHQPCKPCTSSSLTAVMLASSPIDDVDSINSIRPFTLKRSTCALWVVRPDNTAGGDGRKVGNQSAHLVSWTLKKKTGHAVMRKISGKQH